MTHSFSASRVSWLALATMMALALPRIALAEWPERARDDRKAPAAEVLGIPGSEKCAPSMVSPDVLAGWFYGSPEPPIRVGPGVPWAKYRRSSRGSTTGSAT